LHNYIANAFAGSKLHFQTNYSAHSLKADENTQNYNSVETLKAKVVVQFFRATERDLPYRIT